MLLCYFTQWFWLASFVCIAGLLVERWLFFAEAEHVVRLYHGQQRV
jgi:DMSO reductase anchor subunit